MENNNSFSYTYTAPTEDERREIESIRRQYVKSDKAESTAERLRRLHSIVVNSATVVSLVLGVAGTLIFGLGMTCILEWELWLPGVILCVIGASPIAIAYPVYRRILARNKAKYGDEILKLSAELLGEKQE